MRFNFNTKFVFFSHNILIILNRLQKEDVLLIVFCYICFLKTDLKHKFPKFNNLKRNSCKSTYIDEVTIIHGSLRQLFS